MALVVCLTGSVVEGCFIARALEAVCERIRHSGHEALGIPRADLDLPLFTFDRERDTGVPERAVALRAAIRAADALVVGVPEVNGSMTGIGKNALDWAARPASADDDDPFAGLPVAIVSGSKHLHAGLRAADHAKAVLAALGCVVLPGQVAMPFAQRNFTGRSGEIENPELRARLDELAAAVLLAAQVGRLPGARRAPFLDDLGTNDEFRA
jgi:chromate reductase